MKPSLFRKARLGLALLLSALLLTLPCFAADAATPSAGEGMMLVMLISVGTTALMFLGLMLYAKISGRKKK